MKGIVSRFFARFFTRVNLIFVELRTFTLMEGQQIKCEVILPKNEMRGENT